MKKSLLGLAAGSLLAFGSANAAFIMTVSDGFTTHSIEDNVSALDSIANFGAIGFNGTVGSWAVNVTTGTSKPLLQPQGTVFGLDSINISGGTGTFTVTLVDTDFTYDGNLTSFAAITTDGTVDVNAWYDVTNSGIVGAGTSLLDITSSAASASFDGASLIAGGTYSLSYQVVIKHASGVNQTTVGADINIPEPSVLALFGLGLAGLGFAARKKKSA